MGLGIYWAIRLGRNKYNKAEIKKFQQDVGLSAREIEVLQHIASGLSNQEIADILYVSLNTIKTHTNNIYSKLNVKRRTQAIETGRKLKIIS